jgi:hypothetical protein
MTLPARVALVAALVALYGWLGAIWAAEAAAFERRCCAAVIGIAIRAALV